MLTFSQVALQRAAPDVEVPDDQPDAGGFGQFVQVFHPVVGEAVADGENADDLARLLLGSQGRRAADDQVADQAAQ